MDTEFCVDQQGKVLMLQSRPVVEKKQDQIYTINLKGMMNDNVVVTGAYSLLGAVVGTAKVPCVFGSRGDCIGRSFMTLKTLSQGV